MNTLPESRLANLKWDDDSPLLFTDGYKPSHWKLYPKGLEKMQSYFESRVGAKFPYTVFFGLQYFLKRYFIGQVVTTERIDQAEKFFANYFGNADVFNRAGWEYIRDHHNGHLPIKIKAVQEGMAVPTGNVLMTIENTDVNCAWLVNYIETALVQVWYPSTVATQSRWLKERLKEYHVKTGMPDGAIDWTLHDFGYRGVSSKESAALGGAGHLLSFFGSDTIAGDFMLRNYYDAEGLVSGSIPASEHSTVTTWTEAGEEDFLVNALTQFPKGIIANVIDSYDPENYIKNLANKHKDLILGREGKLVFRPDSGNPVSMILSVLGWLDEVFGSTINDQGYKMLPPQVGVIYGDGMDCESMVNIYKTLEQCGWACQNAFGSGGGLLQKLNRDTQRFAFKANWCVVDGQERDVFKRPSSDHTKDSKRGRLALHLHGGEYVTTQGIDVISSPDLLETVYEDGVLIRDMNLSEVRANAKV